MRADQSAEICLEQAMILPDGWDRQPDNPALSVTVQGNDAVMMKDLKKIAGDPV